MSINVIGITGPSGSGKSLICNFLKDKNIAVIDADGVYHSLLTRGSNCTNALSDAFGEDILDERGEPDRKRLAAIVFGSEEKLALLNKIVLGFVISEIERIIDGLEKQGEKNVLVDAPTLIESGFDKKCDCVVSVLAPKHSRIERIRLRDSLSYEAALMRTEAQKSDEFYTEHSNHVLINNKSEEELIERADKLFGTILKH